MCRNLSRQASELLYDQVMADDDSDAMRSLCQHDLYYLLFIAFKRADIANDWLYARCREVEAHPDGYLDLWAREHYKSTIITYALSIQDILRDCNVTIGIFSHTRPIAKGFLSQIKLELELNTFLQDLFPDILYKHPKKESPRWSMDNGLIVKRTQNPKESTVDAWGLVDGQPTSKHYGRLVYDDVVTLESVTNEEQMKKTTLAWEVSTNLGAHGGKVRIIGTRYHFNDTYRSMLSKQSAIPRIYAATEDGTVLGVPIFLTRESLAKKYRDQGPYTFGCQMLQNPRSDAAMGFQEGWLLHYNSDKYIRDGWPRSWNYYLLCDPAGAKKKSNDYTVMWVIGLGPDGNYYLVDGLRDRLDLVQRTKKMFEFHRRYRPKGVGYEKYGKDSDIEHIKTVMEDQNYRFAINSIGGNMPKNDRIRRLVAPFCDRKFYIPHRLLVIDERGKNRDLVQEFITDEFTAFPVGIHDDMLDCMSRIIDPQMGPVFPKFRATNLNSKPVFANNKFDMFKR